MTETRVRTEDLRIAIEHAGYYPGLVIDAVASALGPEPVTAFFVQHDAIFDPGMEVRRHMTVLALTPTTLVYSHTDAHPADETDRVPRAQTTPVHPAWGQRRRVDWSAPLLAWLGERGPATVLGLPATRGAGLLVVDGMGWEQLRGHQAAAPFLSELAFNSRPLTCGFPATTVTSLATIGTALAPGQHGMLGLRVAIPGEGRLLDGLHWPQDVDPASWQVQPTIYHRARAAGITVSHVADGAFEGPALSRAARGGATTPPSGCLGGLAARAVPASHEL